MTTSTTKWIAALAMFAGLLTTHGAFAKGGPGKGGSGGNSHTSSHMNSSNFSAFKMGGNNSSTNHSNGISKKNLNPGLTFKKPDFNKDPKKTGVGSITLGNNLKFDKKFDKKLDKKFDSKDFLFKKDNCKKDFCWWDWCYSKNNCYPWYLGCYPTYCYTPSYCYYPTYSCYDYGLPTYSTIGNYSGSLTVAPTVEPSRTQVPVGSVLMVNGQAFGEKAGGARLRVRGMAMPIEVLEWTATGVKVRLPMLEITGNTPADIEVVRGDGSLASKTAVELTVSPEQLALRR